MLKVQSVILIHYTFSQIQRIAPHSPLTALHAPTVCELKKTLWCSYTVLFLQLGKQSGLY